jgi:YHS domain-containing protein
VNSPAININSVKDPVCGMTVNPKMTDIVATFEEQAYYFCAEGCRETFLENPCKYLKPKKKGLWGRYIERLEKATGGQSMKCH